MTYEKRGDKWVFCKDGVYFAMTFDQVHEMNELTDGIIREETDAMLERGDIDFHPLPGLSR